MQVDDYSEDSVYEPKWEDLNPMTRKIKIEEESLRRMLEGLKKQDSNYNSDILIRLIENELKDPRL